MLEVAKRKNKVHQGWHVLAKICMCSYNSYSTFLVVALAKMHFLWKLPYHQKIYQRLSRLENAKQRTKSTKFGAFLSKYGVCWFFTKCHYYCNIISMVDSGLFFIIHRPRSVLRCIKCLDYI